ncbi:MAG: alginate lyase family protein [Acidobacteriota bacterium]
MRRRDFLWMPAAAALASRALARQIDVAAIDRTRVIAAARKYLNELPLTITAKQSPRSSGGLHDFFSEGDYWWPDPNNASEPYIQRDGMTNPDNFVAHRQAMMRLSVQVPALVAAWHLSGNRRYAVHAIRHLHAWFLDEKTMMNPHLLYAQAIKGRFTGRGIGIIDTIHLVEVVRAMSVLERGGMLSSVELDGLRDWFAKYASWMTTHQYGKDERDAKNNHGTCWVMQAAEFARYLGRTDLTAFCRDRFKSVLLQGQLADDGSFPQELRRTKPYGYSLFNLDAMSTICQTLSTREDNLWMFRLPDGRGMHKAMEFMFPYIADKKKWPYPPDVMYFDEWPVRHASLLFAGIALDRPEYLALWSKLNPDSAVEEVIRNYPIRQPILWL